MLQWKETEYLIIFYSRGRRRSKEISRRGNSKCWAKKMKQDRENKTR